MDTAEKKVPQPEGSNWRIIDRPPRSLLDAPLEFIFAEHARHRNACAIMLRLCDEKVLDRSVIEMIRLYLMEDLPLHRIDEEENLFPALRRCARKEDDLEAILRDLCSRHRTSESAEKQILEAFAPTGLNGAIPLPTSLRTLIENYVRDEQRHIAIENGVVMAIAGIRLNANELRNMSEAMKARRRAKA